MEEARGEGNAIIKQHEDALRQLAKQHEEEVKRQVETRIKAEQVSAKQQLNMAMSKGQKNPGNWGTLDDIPDVSYVRNQLAVTPEFKETITHVQKFKVPKGTRIQIGIVGPQEYKNVIYPGGGTQVQIISLPSGRMLEPVGSAQRIY